MKKKESERKLGRLVCRETKTHRFIFGPFLNFHRPPNRTKLANCSTHTQPSNGLMANMALPSFSCILHLTASTDSLGLTASVIVFPVRVFTARVKIKGVSMRGEDTQATRDEEKNKMQGKNSPILSCIQKHKSHSHLLQDAPTKGMQGIRTFTCLPKICIDATGSRGRKSEGPSPELLSRQA